MGKRKRCIHDIVLCILDYLECEGRKNISDIQHHCKVSTRTFYRIVKMLEKHGICHTYRNGRNTLVEISENGRRLLAHLKAIDEILPPVEDVEIVESG